MIRARTFRVSDAELICPTALDSQVRDNPQDWQPWAEINASNPAVTVFVDDTIVFASGIRLGTHKDGTVGNIWTVLTPEAKKHKREVLIAERLLAQLWIKGYNLKWLYSDSRKGFRESQTLLEHCGFTRTSIETKDYYIYKLGEN